MDLSLVIRTAIVTDGRVMAQFGAGIVADSDPAAEWAETVVKGRCIVEALERGGAATAAGGTRLACANAGAQFVP